MQFEKTEQASESDMTGILELSDYEFKITMINTFRALINKQYVRLDGEYKQR